jgi:hypothetical protein
MITISAVMNVYNEERLLPYSLPPLLRLLDQVILVDGSEDGPSTDKTQFIVSQFQKEYGQKIVYISGTYRRADGAWDDSKQRNEGLKRVTSTFVMHAAADMIYDYTDVAMIVDMAEKYPDKLYFYCPQLEFFVDTEHINLSGVMESEQCLRRPLCGTAILVAMIAEPYCLDVGEYQISGYAAHKPIDYQRDAIYMPHVKRFHYAYVKPFPEQVTKILKYIVHGECGPSGKEVQIKGKKAMYDYAIERIMSWQNLPNYQDYAGVYPQIGAALRDMNVMDGYDEFSQWYEKEFNTECP